MSSPSELPADLCSSFISVAVIKFSDLKQLRKEAYFNSKFQVTVPLAWKSREELKGRNLKARLVALPHSITCDQGPHFTAKEGMRQNCGGCLLLPCRQFYAWIAYLGIVHLGNGAAHSRLSICLGDGAAQSRLGLSTSINNQSSTPPPGQDMPTVHTDLGNSLVRAFLLVVRCHVF